MTADRDTTSRITLYRLKERADLPTASIAGYNKVAEGTESSSGYDYTLWFGNLGEYTPSWFPPFKDIASTHPKVKQAGFVMLANTPDATYACTGGLGYHKLFESHQIEPRFGLAVAKKLLAVHELKGLVQKDASGIVNNLDRAFRGTYNPQGDIDNLHRVLTALRASFPKGGNKYAEIGSSIRAGDSLAANKARDFKGIFTFIKNVDEFWNSNATGLAIPELEHINPKHEQALVAQLNQQLAIEIRDIRIAGDSVRPDLFLDNAAMGYLPDRVIEYTLCHNRCRTTCASFDDVYNRLARILADFDGEDDLLYTELESVRIKIKFDDDFENQYKPVLQYVCGDVVLDNESYFINNGLWFKANAEFVAKINSELDELLYVPPDDLTLQEWADGEDEDAYNTKHSGNGVVVLDKRLVRIQQEKGPVEFCDLLHSVGDGAVNLIHVKHASGAELRALFAQGFVSAQLYSESDEFRAKIHSASIDRSRDLTAQDKAALSNLADHPKREFCIVYAIFDDEQSHSVEIDEPSRISEVLDRTITLFAKIDLLGRVQAIRALGYNVAITRIRPYPSRTE